MLMKVLIVEDSSVVRKVLRNLLRNTEGLAIGAECRSASSAIAAIRQNPPDIILLDIQLNAGTGMDVLNMVAADYPAIKVIVATNFTEDVYRSHYLKAGAYAFFDKSMELPSLQNCVEQLISN